jgi:actin
VPYFYLGNRGTLALLGEGYLTGLAVKLGNTISHAVPVYEGYALPYAVETSEIGGDKMLESFRSQLTKNKGYDFTCRGSKELARDALHKYGRTQTNMDKENITQGVEEQETTYQLPDGRSWKIGNERFICTEGLFDPSLWDNGSNPFLPQSPQTMIKRALAKSGVQSEILDSSIVLSGGVASIHGVQDRLRQELSQELNHARFKMMVPKHPLDAAWQGGSILGKLECFQRMAISKDEYDEIGPKLVHRKCF